MSGFAAGMLGSEWRLSGRTLILAGITALAGLACADLAVLHAVTQIPGRVSDFFAFWSFAKFVHANVPAAIYDVAALHRFQVGLGVDTQFPFLYPPGILLVLWPFGLLPYPAAFALWVAASLALYVASLGERQGWAWTVPALLLAPATILCGALGQSGFLVGALLIGGLRLTACRPALGGMLLGLATLKPQFALLVPVALVAAGLRRALLTAGATGVAVITLSSIAFGPAVWVRWLAALSGFPGIISQEHGLFPVMPTVTGNLHLLGAPPPLAAIAQSAAAAAAAAAVFRAFRTGPSRPAIAALLAGAFLATPYALISDLSLPTAAAVLLVQDRFRRGRSFRTAEIAVLALTFWLPYLMIGLAPFAFSAAVVALVVPLALGACEPKAVSVHRLPVEA